MKKIVFLSLFVCAASLASFSQHWMRDLYLRAETEEITFQDMKGAFSDWSYGRDLSKIKGWRSFKRWEWFYEQRAYPGNTIPDQMIHYRELMKVIESGTVCLKTNGSWTSMSPATLPPSPDPQSIHGMGRINCIAFHPTDTFTFWIGASQGGVWKTTDGGSTWLPLTDNLPVMAVSDIAVNPLDPDVIFLSTGDIEYIGYNTIAAGRPVQFGAGLLKTVDGGATWDTTGLNYLPSQGQVTLLRRVFIHPTDTNRIVAGGVNGIFVSDDGGVSWTQTQTGVFIDLDQNPDNPNTIFAMGYYQPGFSGSGARMYKTTDFGQTWTELITTIPVTGSVLRTEIAIAPSDTNCIYALSCSYSGGFNSFHRSLDGGANWEKVASRQAADQAPNMLGWADGDYFGFAFPGVPPDTTGQGTYDLTLIVDPADKDKIFSGGVNVWGSTNGGVGGGSSTWNVASMWLGYFGPSAHADQHCMAYHPLTGELFLGGDGGLYKTDSLQLGNLDEIINCINLITFEIIPGCYELPTDWTYLSHGVHNTEFYRLGLSRADKDMIVGGTQDNGTYLYKNNAWLNTYGGDGMEAMLHHTNPNVIYATNYNGALSKSTDGGLTYTSGIEGPITGAGETGDWVTPFVMDPLNPEILYAGFNNVWKSEDGGANWTKISTFGNIQNLRALAVAPTAPWYIYASRASSIYKTENGGNDWQSISTGLPMAQAMLTYIAVDYYNPETVWVTFSGFQVGKKVYRSTDAGANWVNISHNLPNVPASCIVHQAGFNSNSDTLNGLYVGTDIGVFYTNDSLLQTAEPWILFNGGLPGVIINELEIQYEAQKIVAASYGRGIWESPLYEETTVEALNIGKPQIYQPVFSVFPNPADDVLNIVINTSVPGKMVVDIFDLQGKKLMSTEFFCTDSFQGSIDISSLPSGSYFVKTRNGNTDFSASVNIVR
jgi:photosystem II stability/assembly factor-like uncharacterized protein